MGGVKESSGCQLAALWKQVYSLRETHSSHYLDMQCSLHHSVGHHDFLLQWYEYHRNLNSMYLMEKSTSLNMFSPRVLNLPRFVVHPVGSSSSLLQIRTHQELGDQYCCYPLGSQNQGVIKGARTFSVKKKCSSFLPMQPSMSIWKVAQVPFAAQDEELGWMIFWALGASDSYHPMTWITPADWAALVLQSWVPLYLVTLISILYEMAQMILSVPLTTKQSLSTLRRCMTPQL
mmetsp:Transcript_3158/g.7419  ORF Transcript_3158/g.7419 Transcript_3158/m.7419 type:complete len:233 (+) Transcript_3158:3755-4453(+)